MNRKKILNKILPFLLCSTFVITTPIYLDAEAQTSTEVTLNSNNNENLVKGANCKAEHTYSLSSGYEANKAIDGNMGTRWASAEKINSSWFEIEFAKETSLNQIVINEYSDSAITRRIKDLKIEYWNGEGWTLEKSIDFSLLPSKGEINLDNEITTSKIRLTFSNSSTNKSFNVSEIEIYNKKSYENYALNKKATSMNHYDDGEYILTPNLAIDGNANTRWASEHYPDKDFWFEIDLEKNIDINNIMIKEHNQYTALDKIDIYYSKTESGDDWTLAKKVYASDYSLDKDIYFDRVNARRVKLVFNKVSGRQGYNINEIELYNKADEDIPAPPPEENYIKPIPSDKPNVYQRRKEDMKYGMFIHFGVNTFVDQEWTDGSIPASAFAPTAIDAEQWVKTAWEAGMNYVVLITKHHDGFSLWDSKYTDYDVANSQNNTDVIKAVADACKKYGIKLGMYYSLWDRNWDSRYGKENNEQYADYMINQLTELMDGRYGEVVELWLDGGWEKPASAWQLGRVYDTVKRLQPGCQISTNLTLGQDYFPEDHEEGSEIAYFPSDFRLYDPYMTNPNGDPKLFTFRDETYYLPFESTQCLKSTWFYNTRNDSEGPRHSPDKIKEMTEQLVNQQNTFVLNAAPNREGKLLQNDIDTLYSAARKMGIARGSASLEKDEENLAYGSLVKVSEEPYGAEYSGSKLVDGSTNTRWATADGANNNKWAEIDFKKEVEFDRVEVFEATYQGMGERINKYLLEYFDGEKWVTASEGTTIGSKKEIKLDKKVTAEKIRFTCSSAGKGPTISEIQVYDTVNKEEIKDLKTVRVEYVNEDGFPVQSPDLLYGKSGEAYKIETKDLTNLGYKLISQTNNTEGVFSNEEILVRYLYEDIGENVDEDIIVSKPLNLTIEDKKTNSLLLKWDKPENNVGLISYTIYKDGKELTTTTDLKFNVTDLKANTIYGFKVTANYSNGESSNPVSINTRTLK